MVALSFAGAQRDYVRQVAEALKARGVRCFYDADEQVQLWGTYLAEELPLIYARESVVVVVVFVSTDYAAGDWTRLERRAAFSQAVADAGVYVLPARFDDSELIGLLPDVVAVDLRDRTPEQFADLVVAKLADLGISPSPVPGGGDRELSGEVRADETDRDRRRRVSRPVTAALIGGSSVIVVAAIAIAVTLGGHPRSPSVPGPSNSASVSSPLAGTSRGVSDRTVFNPDAGQALQGSNRQSSGDARIQRPYGWRGCQRSGAYTLWHEFASQMLGA